MIDNSESSVRNKTLFHSSEELEIACGDAHIATLDLVSDLVITGRDQSSAEAMTLLLSTSQLAHTYLSLSRLDSPLALEIIQPLKNIASRCLESCRQTAWAAEMTATLERIENMVAVCQRLLASGSPECHTS